MHVFLTCYLIYYKENKIDQAENKPLKMLLNKNSFRIQYASKLCINIFTFSIHTSSSTLHIYTLRLKHFGIESCAMGYKRWLLFGLFGHSSWTPTQLEPYLSDHCLRSLKDVYILYLFIFSLSQLSIVVIVFSFLISKNSVHCVFVFMF